jgi:hypothetical protein
MSQPFGMSQIPPMDERNQEATEHEKYVGARPAELKQQAERRDPEIRRGA